MHAAVIAINEAIDKQVATETLAAMSNPESHLNSIYPELADTYQDVLYEAKDTKAEIARNKVSWFIPSSPENTEIIATHIAKYILWILIIFCSH